MTLSDKRDDKLMKCDKCETSYCTLEETYFKLKDVKEFIQKVTNEMKDRINLYTKYIETHEHYEIQDVLRSQLKTMIKIIDKLAGKELI